MGRRHRDLLLVVAIVLIYYVTVTLRGPTLIVIWPGLALYVAPGYVWSQILVGPRARGLERFAITCVLALAVPVFGGLVLYAADIPLRRSTWAALLACIGLVGALWLSFLGGGSEFQWPAAGRIHWTWPIGPTIALAAATVIGAGALVIARVSAEARHYPGFTQLWLAPQKRSAYEASLGVSNHQGAAARYKLVLLHKRRVVRVWHLSLEDGEAWQTIVSISGPRPTSADLYRLPDLSRPYRYVTTGNR